VHFSKILSFSASLKLCAGRLSKNLTGSNLIFTHPKLSNDTAEKIGAKSFRSTLINQSTDLDFGSGVLHESFSQTESITRRLKSIVEMYPEGPQQLFELIQSKLYF
jgi:hypothetical protein